MTMLAPDAPATAAEQGEEVSPSRSPLAPPLVTPKAANAKIYDYERLIREFPESNLSLELWDGTIVMAPAPNIFHQDLLGELYLRFRAFVDPQKSGRIFISPVDMVLTRHLVVQPDLMFVSKERLSIAKEALQGPADLVLEVVSPGSRTKDRIDKLDVYSQFAVKEYWIVDPEAKMIEIFSFDGLQLKLVQRAASGQKAASWLLSGFEVDINQLWAAVTNLPRE